MNAMAPSAVTRKNDRPGGAVSCRRWSVLVTLAALAAGGDALAIKRCDGEHGEVMFTQSCPGPAARPRTRPSNQAHTATVPASAGGSCARTPQQLEQQVLSALATRNGIRLSGLILWRGVSARAARGEARELLPLLKSGSAAVALEATSTYPGHDPYDVDVPTAAHTPGPGLLVMPLTERRGFTHSERLRFDIVRDHGCYWLRPGPQRVFDGAMQTQQAGGSDEIEPLALRGR